MGNDKTIPEGGRVCFFVKTADPSIFTRVEFYSQDIKALQEIGYTVVAVSTIRELLAIKADVYFVWWWTWSIVPLVVGYLKRKPVFIRGVFDDWAFQSRNIFHRLCMRLSLKYALKNIFVSNLEYNEIPKKFPTRNPVLIPCCVDTEIYCRKEMLEQGQSLFLLTVAWLKYGNAQRKGIPELIEAMPAVVNEFPRIKLIVAGQIETDSEPLFQRVTELGMQEHILFPGRISLEKKIELMQSCAVYIQPSRFEGFGLAALEAMSCGAVIVATSTGAVPEVVGDSGLFVEGTPCGITEGILKLLRDSDLRNKMSVSSRHRAVSNFSYAQHVELLRREMNSL